MSWTKKIMSMAKRMETTFSRLEGLESFFDKPSLWYLSLGEYYVISSDILCRSPCDSLGYYVTLWWRCDMKHFCHFFHAPWWERLSDVYTRYWCAQTIFDLVRITADYGTKISGDVLILVGCILLHWLSKQFFAFCINFSHVLESRNDCHVVLF